ncbi:hypothetical protein KSP40_PGU003752 [Platanthera guangdongensis]|uniref:Uncharacterized protein n=1 Tax=Platanthera guangdongensis TaxID=2320717 RepID=A0ABR2LPB0_9ASPA
MDARFDGLREQFGILAARVDGLDRLRNPRPQETIMPQVIEGHRDIEGLLTICSSILLPRLLPRTSKGWTNPFYELFISRNSGQEVLLDCSIEALFTILYEEKQANEDEEGAQPPYDGPYHRRQYELLQEKAAVS